MAFLPRRSRGSLDRSLFSWALLSRIFILFAHCLSSIELEPDMYEMADYALKLGYDDLTEVDPFVYISFAFCDQPIERPQRTSERQTGSVCGHSRAR